MTILVESLGRLYKAHRIQIETIKEMVIEKKISQSDYEYIIAQRED